MDDRAAKTIDWACSFLVLTYHFVHHILAMARKTETPDIQTIGVRVSSSGKISLGYNAEFVSSLKDTELIYVLYHEALHVMFHHCTHRRIMPDMGLWNTCCDLAINELIPNDKGLCTRPKEGCFVDELKKKDPRCKTLENRQTAEYYYDFLSKLNEGKGKGGKSSDGEGSEDSEDKDSLDKPEDSQDNYGKPIDDHDGWGNHEIADEHVRQKVNEIDKRELWGNVSSADKEMILAAQIIKINWRSKIKVWFGNHTWQDRMPTRKKPNRRTGYMHPGYKKSYRDKYLVVADTSGSICEKWLGQWVGVLNQLVEHIPLDFMQCDCEIQTQPRPYDRRKLSIEFSGRGGTDFQPIFNLATERHYKGLMVLTDGCADKPTEPRGMHVLWVMPEGMTPPVEWGDRVYLNQYS
jgi:predicted metal-dependent peptidase